MVPSRHGPRQKPCPGSNKPRVQASSGVSNTEKFRDHPSSAAVSSTTFPLNIIEPEKAVQLVDQLVTEVLSGHTEVLKENNFKTVIVLNIPKASSRRQVKHSGS